ncbi:hypothetical protein ABZT47_33110 [Sphaerisporangium sp. NPDC005289]|uniref:hypothetical protein n=1 Tax=Sphaerisporangium sp. NPDC005289 TaxID=3155247 RepID=UPI0033B5D404
MIRITFVITAALAALPLSALTASADAGSLAAAGSTMAPASSATASAPKAPCSKQGCGDVVCPPGYTCVYSPKQCFTMPCPQYECVAVGGGYPVTPPYVLPYPYPYPYPYSRPGWWPRPYPHYPRPIPGPHYPSGPRPHILPAPALPIAGGPQGPSQPGVRDAQLPIQQPPGRPGV